MRRSDDYLQKNEILGILGPVLERPDELMVVKGFCKAHMTIENFENWEDLVDEARDLFIKDPHYYEEI